MQGVLTIQDYVLTCTTSSISPMSTSFLLLTDKVSMNCTLSWGRLTQHPLELKAGKDEERREESQLLLQDTFSRGSSRLRYKTREILILPTLDLGIDLRLLDKACHGELPGDHVIKRASPFSIENRTSLVQFFRETSLCLELNCESVFLKIAILYLSLSIFISCLAY